MRSFSSANFQFTCGVLIHPCLSGCEARSLGAALLPRPPKRSAIHKILNHLGRLPHAIFTTAASLYPCEIRDSITQSSNRRRAAGKRACAREHSQHGNTSKDPMREF